MRDIMTNIKPIRSNDDLEETLLLIDFLIGKDGPKNKDEIDVLNDLVQHYESMQISSSVKHPDHYNAHPSGVECIEIVEHFNYNIGNAMKYLWRCDLKDDPIENLEKAMNSVHLEIKRRKRMLTNKRRKEQCQTI